MHEMIDRVNILEFKKMIYILTTKIFIFTTMCGGLAFKIFTLQIRVSQLKKKMFMPYLELI